jgi:RND family efflux transporter MFP subunit
MRSLLLRLRGGALPWSRRRVVLAALAAVVAAGGASAFRRAGPPATPTAEARIGEFVDSVEVRGEVKAARSVTLTAPSGTEGDVQIVWLVRNGTIVKKGDEVVRFDTARLQRTLEQHRSDLKRTEAEIQGAQAQARLTAEQNQTELMQARYAVERARLDVKRQEILSPIEGEKNRLRLGDAEQRLKEAEQKLRSGEAAAAAETASKRQKKAKALFEVQKAERAIAAMTLRAPVDGMVALLPNFRGRFFGSSAPEFKEGDRVWAGAAIVELPDLGSVRLSARVDEAERGRLAVAQTARVRVDAVPDKEFTGKVTDISPLAKVDFSTWPPPKNFDFAVQLDQTDPRLRPGMSATARVAVQRIPGVLLLPASATFQRAGRSVAYVLRGSRFEEREVEVARRNREHVVVARGVASGEKVALKDPTEGTARQ